MCEVLFCVYSVEKLFRHRFKQNFGGHQTPTQVASVDCRASYEASVFEVLISRYPKRVFQQNMSEAELGEVPVTGSKSR
jgi:hypothetical protein